MKRSLNENWTARGDASQGHASNIGGRKQFILLLCSSILLNVGTGCIKQAKLGFNDTPPLPPAKPGVFCDVNPRFSHDGKRIAFLRETPDRRLQLHLIDPNLETPKAILEAESLCQDRPYSPTLAKYCSPDTLVWSPNNQLIAFERAEWFAFEDGERLPGTGIWAFDTKTGRVTPIALHPKLYTEPYYYYHAPSWSPDGKYFAFTAEGINGQRKIAVRPVGQDAATVTPHFDNAENSDWVCWSPRKTIEKAEIPLMIYRQGVIKSPSIPQTETLRGIRPGSPDKPFSGEVWRISPSELGKLQAAEYRDENRAGSTKSWQNQFTVVPRIGHPVWSRDGRRLAFTLTADANDFSRYELWVWSIDTQTAIRVSPLDSRGYFAPVWIDRNRLGAISPDGNRFSVMSVNLTNNRSRKLGTIETADCDWSPDRSQVVYASPKQNSPIDSDDKTTLKSLDTGIHATIPWRLEITRYAP